MQERPNGGLVGATFTACMPLLTATRAFRLGRRCHSTPQHWYLHRIRTIWQPFTWFKCFPCHPATLWTGLFRITNTCKKWL